VKVCFIVLGICLSLGAMTRAGVKCPDLSGHYLMHLDDLQVQLLLTQTACEKIEITKTSEEAGHQSKETHQLSIDGHFQKDTAWNGGSPGVQSSAVWMGQDLEVTVKEDSSAAGLGLKLKSLYKILLNKNLSIKEWDPETKSYGPEMIAERQKK